MNLDDGERARLAQIERQLTGEEPELAGAMRRWHRPGPPWAARLTVAGGLMFVVIALLLGSVGWALLAGLTFAIAWGMYRMAGSDRFVPRVSADSASERDRWWREL